MIHLQTLDFHIYVKTTTAGKKGFHIFDSADSHYYSFVINDDRRFSIMK